MERGHRIQVGLLDQLSDFSYETRLFGRLRSVCPDGPRVLRCSCSLLLLDQGPIPLFGSMVGNILCLLPLAKLILAEKMEILGGLNIDQMPNTGNDQPSKQASKQATKQPSKQATSQPTNQPMVSHGFKVLRTDFVHPP